MFDIFPCVISSEQNVHLKMIGTGIISYCSEKYRQATTIAMSIGVLVMGGTPFPHGINVVPVRIQVLKMRT